MVQPLRVQQKDNKSPSPDTMVMSFVLTQNSTAKILMTNAKIIAVEMDTASMERVNAGQDFMEQIAGPLIKHNF